jgi:hypothetical protein
MPNAESRERMIKMEFTKITENGRICCSDRTGSVNHEILQPKASGVFEEPVKVERGKVGHLRQRLQGVFFVQVCFDAIHHPVDPVDVFAS